MIETKDEARELFEYWQQHRNRGIIMIRSQKIENRRRAFFQTVNEVSH